MTWVFFKVKKTHNKMIQTFVYMSTLTDSLRNWNVEPQTINDTKRNEKIVLWPSEWVEIGLTLYGLLLFWHVLDNLDSKQAHLGTGERVLCGYAHIFLVYRESPQP